MYSTRITLAAFCPLPTRKLFVWRPQHRAALQRKADAEAVNLSSVVDPKYAAPQVAGQGAEVMYAVVVPQRGVYGQTAGVGGSNDGAALAHDLPACVDGRRVAEPVRAGQRSKIHDPALGGPAERPRQERVVLSQARPPRPSRLWPLRIRRHTGRRCRARQGFGTLRAV